MGRALDASVVTRVEVATGPDFLVVTNDTTVNGKSWWRWVDGKAVTLETDPCSEGVPGSLEQSSH